MSRTIVEPVASSAQRRQFLEFPWTLYRGDPNWVPPLRGNQAELTGFVDHPFYETNQIQTFLAIRNGEVRGRIAAILNQGHIDRHGERRGFFGFFECYDDDEAAWALFDAVAGWFAERGIYRLRGPTNPSLNYELGLLVQGFDRPPTFMMTYNPPYYQRLVESYGFVKSQDLLSFVGNRAMLPKVEQRLKGVSEQIIEHLNVKLRTLDTSRFQEDVESFLSIYNRSLVNTWGFVPMSPDEVRHIAKGLRHLIVPEISIAAEIDGTMIGAVFGLPDFNPRIKQIDGRLFPFGFARLLWKKHLLPRIRLISTNVIPEYQRMGVGLALMYGLAPKAISWGVQEAEFSWVLETNLLSRGSLEKGGAVLEKVHRVYDLDRPPAGDDRPTAEQLARWRPGNVDVRAVAGGADGTAFVELPKRLYADDPQWVAPLDFRVREFIDPARHPFYRHAAAQLFVARRGSKVVGRILASDDPQYNRQQQANAGMFGLFESIDDRHVAAALLEAAAAWLRQRGRTQLIGPIDYSTNYTCGLLVDGFDTPPRVMMNHNPPYYQRLIEDWGLEKVKDLYAWWFDDPHDLAAKWRPRLERIARRSGAVVRPFRQQDFESEVRRCLAVYNAAQHDNWGFVPLSEAEFFHLADEIRRIADPEHVLLAEVGDRPVGLAITLPDLNEAARPLRGRLTRWGLPLGALRLAHRLKRVKTGRMIVLDILDEYRRRGLAELLILRTLEYGKNRRGYSGAELSWTIEDNQAVNGAIAAVGGRRYKTYRVYQKAIG